MCMIQDTDLILNNTNFGEVLPAFSTLHHV